MRLALVALALCLAPIAARAQTVACPAVTQGQVWTVAQWNTCLGSLAAATGGVLASPVVTGGTFTSPVIAGGTITGAAVQPSGGIGQIVALVTAAGTVVPSVALSEIVVIAKTTPAATAVTLPASSNWPACPSASLTACPAYVIKDGAGNAATYPIAVSTADAKTIDGASSATISTNYGAVRYVLNGTQWNAVP